MFSWWQTLVALVLLLFGWYAWWKLKNRHIGCGMQIRRFSDGTVRITSRLTSSPAGRAGIANGAELLRYNGVDVRGLSREDFIRKFAETQPKKVGEMVVCFVRQDDTEKEVAMLTEMIQGPIPEYFSVRIPEDEAWRYTQGMAWCTRTSQFIQTTKLSDEAVNAILR